MKKSVIQKIYKSAIFVGLVALSSLSFAKDPYDPVKTPQVVEAAKGKVLVQQFLWHKCIHCYHLEPLVDKWLKEKPETIEFERIPVAWNNSQLNDGSYYNLAKVMFKTQKINADQLNEINNKLFDITFVDKKELNDASAYNVFKDYGFKDEAEFKGLLNSFVTSTEKSKSYTLTKEYGVNGVPVFVVDGKYFVSFETIGQDATPEVLFKTINDLAEKQLKEKNNKPQ